MNKRFYIIIGIVFSFSLLLLGFSFAKESGTSDNVGLHDIVNDNSRSIFSNDGKLDTLSNNSLTISIINKLNENANYVLSLKEINDKGSNNIYVTVDGGKEFKLNGSTINLGNLKAYGSNGDHVTRTIKIRSNDSNVYSYKLDVIKTETNLLSNVIRKSSGVYVDSSNNVRYYGVNPNNYIKVNNEVMRILGIIDNKILVISDYKGNSNYNQNSNYLALDDYLSSFNVMNINRFNSVSYTSWLTGNMNYWLKDTSGASAYYINSVNGIILSSKLASYNTRIVNVIPNNSVLVRGNGTINSPYEVNYGSK